MPLSSASTFDEIRDSYKDNATYVEDGSVTKAKAFVTACIMLLLELPKQASTRESSLALSPELIKDQMDSANRWLAANDTSADSASSTVRVTRSSFRDFRT